ncbi:hypothetical protein BE20_32095 [Sorangium cellulosum]|nr:hypothetical protein BE20_32095 [Sorangium cellulosum]
MRRLEHREDRVRAPGGAVRVERGAERGELVGQGPAEEPLHREVRPAVGELALGVQLRDVGHPHALEERGLAPEPLADARRCLPRHLDGRRRAVVVPLRGPDVREAAAPERAEQREAVDRGRRACHDVGLAGRRREAIPGARRAVGEPPVTYGAAMHDRLDFGQPTVALDTGLLLQ